MTAKVHIMQQERDPLNLGSLPLVSPPADDWRKRIVALAAGTLAIAATAFLIVGVFFYQPFGIPAGTPGSEQAQNTQVDRPKP